MPRYTIKASVTVDIEIDVPAENRTEAQAILTDKLMMTAALVDMDHEDWTVDEDTISEISHVRIEDA